MADILKLKIAKELEKNSMSAESLTTIQPLWRSHTWRDAKWPALGKEVSTILYQTALAEQDISAQTMSLWELLGTLSGGVAAEYADIRF